MPQPFEPQLMQALPDLPTTLLGGEYSAEHKNMLQLIQLRWAAAVGQVATIVVVPYGFHIDLPIGDMLIVLAFLVAFNLFSLVRWRQPRATANGELFLALLVDVAALSAQLYFSGGTANPFVFLYLLQVTLAAVLLKTRATWTVVGIACACFAGLALRSHPLNLPEDHEHGLASLYVQGMLICFILNATLLVLCIKRISRNVRARDMRLVDLRQRAAEHEHLVRMGLLASGAAHELGTPLSTLSVILGDWRHMPKLAASATLQADMKEMTIQVQRCKNIVSGILLSAGEARGESSMGTTVCAFLDEVAQEWRATRSVVTFTYENRFSPDLPVVSDSTLKQTINNILDNALEASPQWVSLEVERVGDKLVLRVTDHGPGFSQAILESFGKPYHSSKARAGAGLGLYLVVNVVRTLGGSVSPGNRPQGGAVVKLSLPLSAIKLREGD